MKKFRIVRNELSEEIEREAFHPLRWKIEQKYSIFLGMISLWGTPDFAPPHDFEHVAEAANAIWKHYPKAKVYQMISKRQ